MIHKKPFIPQRLRTIQGSFATIEHRFLRDGLMTSTSSSASLPHLYLTTPLTCFQFPMRGFPLSEAIRYSPVRLQNRQPPLTHQER
jgi:hypothetical protein